MLEPMPTAIALGATGVLLVAAALMNPLSQRLGVPVLLVVLGLGMLAGSEGIGGIPFDDPLLAFRLGTVALVLILFDGGLDTPPAVIRRVAVRATVLATFGVVATAVAIAGVAVLLGIPAPIAALVGAVVSSTDAAAVFAALRGSGMRLKETTAATLEVESGLNDPVAMLLTVATTDVLLGDHATPAELARNAIGQLGFGLLGGIAFGVAGRWVMRFARLPAAGLYPVLTVAIACAAYGVPTLAGGSGFLSVYLAGMILAAGPLPYRAGVRRVHDALAWLAQLSMFLLLGLLVFPSHLLPMVVPGVAIGLALAVVARPLAVLLSLAPFAAPRRERLFVAWIGLRGAVPIVLATYPVLRGVPDAEALFDLVFFVVLVNGVVPGMTVGPLARRWALAMPLPPPAPATVELVSLRDYPGEFVWYALDPASAVVGAAVQELPLPEGCVLTIVLRDDRVLAPRGDTVFRAGDQVCVFVTRADRRFLDLVFGRSVEDAD